MRATTTEEDWVKEEEESKEKIDRKIIKEAEEAASFISMGIIGIIISKIPDFYFWIFSVWQIVTTNGFYFTVNYLLITIFSIIYWLSICFLLIGICEFLTDFKFQNIKEKKK